MNPPEPPRARQWSWTTEEVRRAVEMRRAGHPIAAIAQALGRSASRTHYHLGELAARTEAGNELQGNGPASRCRRECERLGWPEVTRPSHARVLAFLAHAGPSTLREIAAGIGWSQNTTTHLSRRVRMLRRLRYVEMSTGKRHAKQNTRYAVAAWLLARKAAEQ